MRRTMAARYCDLSVKDFEREVISGRLPLPIVLGDEERWPKARLDEALERLAGKEADWRAGAGLPSKAG